MKYGINPDGTGQIITSRGIRVYGGTSRNEFEFNILEGLTLNRNGLNNKEIQDMIENEFKDTFNELDKQTLKDNIRRWRKNLDWKKHQMKKDGLIKLYKPEKIWKITEKGVKRYTKLKIKSGT